MSKRSLSSRAIRRLNKEEKLLKNDQNGDSLFNATPKVINGTPDYSTWNIKFTLHEDNSLYKDRIIEAEMSFPEDYPFSPPSLRFVTDMFHPNIYEDGNICISILEKDEPGPLGCGDPEDKWSPVQSIRTILLSVVVLLDNPNPDSPANVDATKLFKFDSGSYSKIVRSLVDNKQRSTMISDALLKLNK